MAFIVFLASVRNGRITIVPDLELYARNYLNDISPSAADEFISQTILSRPTGGTIKFRLLEFFGGYGLMHHWMYDVKSMTDNVIKFGFQISDDFEHYPSYFFNLNDDSVHVFAVKK